MNLEPALARAIELESQTHTLPGGVPWRILLPDSVLRLSAQHEMERREVELAALEQEVVPVHYIRNIARFAIRGQMTLLASSVTLVCGGAPAEQCIVELARAGVGRIRLLVPASLDPEHGPRILSRAAKANHSVSLEGGALDVRTANPAAELAGSAIVAACLEAAVDESLLQAACRMNRIPLVCAGVQGSRLQATTVLPGDPGVARIYRGQFNHLDADRPGSVLAAARAGQVAGAWMAEQTLACLLGHGDLLAGQLRYADLERGQMESFSLDAAG